MPGDDFFRTRTGQRFYDATMPKIADQLERLNTNIEVLVAQPPVRRKVGTIDPNLTWAVRFTAAPGP